MKRWSVLGLAVAALIGAAGPLAAQSGKNDLSGTWKLEKGKVEGNGPRTVIIRADSSASWGEEMVRWRLEGENIMIALGGEWEIYKIKVRGNRITLSGPDLPEDVTLRRVGPPTPRPPDVPVPADPGPVGAK